MENKIKSITIHAINEGQDGGSMSQTVFINDKTTVESLTETKNDFYAKADASYGRWYYEVESMDDFSPEEEQMLKKCELEVDSLG